MASERSTRTLVSKVVQYGLPVITVVPGLFMIDDCSRSTHSEFSGIGYLIVAALWFGYFLLITLVAGIVTAVTKRAATFWGLLYAFGVFVILVAVAIYVDDAHQKQKRMRSHASAHRKVSQNEPWIRGRGKRSARDVSMRRGARSHHP